MDEQTRRDLFNDLTGLVSTIDWIEYGIFCKGVQVGLEKFKHVAVFTDLDIKKYNELTFFYN